MTKRRTSGLCPSRGARAREPRGSSSRAGAGPAVHPPAAGPAKGASAPSARREAVRRSMPRLDAARAWRRTARERIGLRPAAERRRLAPPPATAASIVTRLRSQRKVTPPAPPPTPAQVAALEELKRRPTPTRRARATTASTVTTIVKLHYEEKKKAVLAGLDDDIAIEKTSCKKAREMSRSSGSRSSSRSTAGRRATGGHARRDVPPRGALRGARARPRRRRRDLRSTLKPAIALYKRVIHEFPKYRELAGIYYFLGHALQRLEPRRGVAAGLALARLPQPLRLPDRARPEGSRHGHRRAAAAGPRRAVLDRVASPSTTTPSR